MAVQHGYGKIAGADALVFAYDTGDTRNSYKGEPTTNIVTNPTFLGTPNTQSFAVPANWYFSGDTSATGFRFYNSATAPIPLKFPNEGAVITTGPNATTNRRIYYNGTVEPNTTYTLSYWLYSSAVGSISNYFFTYRADGSGTTSPSYGQGFTTGQWVFIQQSFTTPADTGNTRNVNWGPVISSSVNSLFAMQRFQIEAKSYATQFVNGTRSATQGLLDLTGNSSIDLTNAGFDSNAQLDFDGTSDVIYSPQLPVLDSFSLEVIIKPDALTGWILYRNNNMNYTGNDDNFTFGFSNNKLYGHVEYNPSGADVSVNSTTTLSIGQHAHSIYTYDNASKTLKIYVNGVLEGTTVHTGDSYPYRSTQKMSIGADGGSNHGGIGGNKYFYNGKIPVVKVYNRALTAAEVANNYNHYKGRFNI